MSNEAKTLTSAVKGFVFVWLDKWSLHVYSHFASADLMALCWRAQHRYFVSKVKSIAADGKSVFYVLCSLIHLKI